MFGQSVKGICYPVNNLELRLFSQHMIYDSPLDPLSAYLKESLSVTNCSKYDTLMSGRHSAKATHIIMALAKLGVLLLGKFG